VLGLEALTARLETKLSDLHSSLAADWDDTMVPRWFQWVIVLASIYSISAR